MTEIALRESAPTTDLSIAEGQTGWSDKQRAALVQLGMKPNVSEADLAVFFHHAARTGLDPFARQIYMIERWSKDGPKQTIQTGIDGFRLIARRATDARNGTFGYLPTEWCGQDGQWKDVWLESRPPAAARVTVVRDGAQFPAVALFSEYAQTTKQGAPTQMWASKGSLMLAKCAEALALRKAFPQDLSGLYTGDEMAASGNERPVQMDAPASARDRLSQAVAATVPDEAPHAATGPPISDEQRKILHALVNELGLSRDQKIEGVRHYVGRPVESTSDLTKAEASKVIDALQVKVAERNVTDAGGEVVDAEVVEDALPIGDER